MRWLAAAALTLALAGCGGSDDGPPATAQTAAPAEESDEVTLTVPEWAGRLLSRPGPEGAIVMATSDFAAGPNRLGFLLVRDDGKSIEVPVADVYYKAAGDGPVRKTTAKLVALGVAAGDETTAIYVANVELPETGKRWVVVQPRGAKFQGFQLLDVKRKPAAPGVGDEAIASRNPTLATASLDEVSTARDPDPELYRFSVKESLDEGVPFVVVFATPQFCESRTCGPAVDVLSAVRKRFADSGIRFIHIEIYEDNVPGKGVNRWVREWGLPTEPWVFVVDGGGVIRARFEGAVGVEELDAAVRTHLLGSR